MGIQGILTLLVVGVTAVIADTERIAVVHLTSPDPSKYNVTGEIKLTQAGPTSLVVVEGSLYGLTEGRHGFHIHQSGDMSNGCISAGGHYNPNNHSHGAPGDNVRHVGDLGNIVADKNGVAMISISDNIITLWGEKSVLGRSIVVHALEDDLGLGNHEFSLTTGNAGDRAACGVIGIQSPVDSWGSNSVGSISWSSSTFLISSVTMALHTIQDRFLTP